MPSRLLRARFVVISGLFELVHAGTWHSSQESSAVDAACVRQGGALHDSSSCADAGHTSRRSHAHSAMVQVQSKVSSQPEPQVISRTEVRHQLLEQKPIAVDMRPHLGMRPDVIYFGVRWKGFSGADFTANTFSADLLLTFRWRDSRVISLVPEGLDSFAMPTSHAAKKIWLPDMEITNRALDGVDIISSTVNITSDGSVTKVERVHAVLRAAFVAGAFPFDFQVLPVRLASTTLMLDDLILEPLVDMRHSGVKDDIFENSAYHYVSENEFVFAEADGLLEKSRGELDIFVRRNSMLYIQSVFMPSFLIVSVSWAGFFIPIGMPPFLMPRIATSFISLLAQVTLSLKFDNMQPERGDVSWLDVFEECCMTLVYAAVCFNIFVQYVNYQLKLTDMAAKFDIELQVALPALSVGIYIVCFCLRTADEVHTLHTIITLILTLSLLGYLGGCYARMYLLSQEQAKILQRTASC